MEKIELGLGILFLLGSIILAIWHIFTIKPKFNKKNNKLTLEQHIDRKNMTKDICGIIIIFLVIILLSMPVSDLNALADYLVWPGMISFVFLFIYFVFFGRLKIIKFPQSVKKKLKIVKFKSRLRLAMNILIACLSVVFLVGVANIQVNGIEHLKNMETLNFIFFYLLLVMFIWSFKRSILPENIDEILVKSCGLSQNGKNRFYKDLGDGENLNFNYNIVQQNVYSNFRNILRAWELFNPGITIYTEMTINNCKICNNETIKDFEEINNKYYFINFDIVYGKDKIVIRSDYNSNASSKFMLAILLSMYEGAEEIAMELNKLRIIKEY